MCWLVDDFEKKRNRIPSNFAAQAYLKNHGDVYAAQCTLN